MLWFASRKRRPLPTRRPSIQVEALEDRVVLNNRFVVPVALAPDNVNNFATLQAALTTPGLAAGNIIQIQPGSAPGNIVNANLPAVANLTIQGDPAATRAEIPAFGINDAVAIGAAQAGFTLRDVQVVLQGGGITFDANGVVLRSTLTDNFAGTALTFNATTQAVLQDSVIVANAGIGNGEVMRVNVTANSQNRVTGNTIVSRAAVSHTLLYYFGPSTVTDQVLNNTFVGNTGFAARSLFLADALGVNGLTVQGNTFRDADSNQVAVAIGVGTQNLKMNDNTITLAGATGTVGINVVGGGPTPTSVVLSNNRIDTAGNGTGIQFVRTLAGGTYTAKVEGNDLHFDKIGINIVGNLAGSVANLDLGGGSQGSLGANNFRGFTVAASATQGAIVTSAATADGPVSALSNLFRVANPEDVIFDQADVGANANVVATGNLTGNPAFVAALYLDLLGRPPQFAVPNDAINWVNQLGAGASAQGVADAIARSPEALGRRLAQLYRQFLQRDAGAAEIAAMVPFLQAGGTVESLIRNLVASTEYQRLFGSDGAFVQSLFSGLLNRVGGNVEVANQVLGVQQAGRGMVAQNILSSPEYRGIEVRRLYAQKLNRLNPAQAEVDAWVNFGPDLLRIEIMFAASTEFQANG